MPSKPINPPKFVQQSLGVSGAALTQRWQASSAEVAGLTEQNAQPRNARPPRLTSVYGGPIDARLDRNNQAVPLQTIFRVRMDWCTGLDSTLRELSGSVLIGRERRSLLTLGWRRLVAVLRREGTL